MFQPGVASSPRLPTLETLEPRLLFAIAHLSARGTLFLQGSPRSDQIQLLFDQHDLLVSLNGQPRRFSRAAVKRCSIDAGDGADQVLALADIPTTVIGGAGDDLLRTTRRAHVSGSEGADTFDARSFDGPINLSAPQTSAASPAFDGIENVIHIGYRRSQFVQGNASANFLAASGKGLAGHCTIYGGGGNDTLLGGQYGDNLRGQDGNDSLSGNAGSDIIEGGKGNDILIGGAHADALYGGEGNDLLLARDHTSDFLAGGAGRDQASVDTPSTNPKSTHDTWDEVEELIH
ncbi:MAG TPA: calcium-binding protein [Tepidisphaeraceae bacterium]